MSDDAKMGFYALWVLELRISCQLIFNCIVCKNQGKPPDNQYVL